MENPKRKEIDQMRAHLQIFMAEYFIGVAEMEEELARLACAEFVRFSLVALAKTVVLSRLRFGCSHIEHVRMDGFVSLFTKEVQHEFEIAREMGAPQTCQSQEMN